jgi:hypothetical protein
MNYGKRSDAEKVRDLLAKAGLSQRAAAREVDVSDRVMRYYCSGEEPVPRAVMLAHIVCLQRQVEARKE